MNLTTESNALDILRTEATRLENFINRSREYYEADVLRLEADQAEIERTVVRLKDMLLAIEKLESE